MYSWLLSNLSKATLRQFLSIISEYISRISDVSHGSCDVDNILAMTRALIGQTLGRIILVFHSRIVTFHLAKLRSVIAQSLGVEMAANMRFCGNNTKTRIQEGCPPLIYLLDDKPVRFFKQAPPGWTTRRLSAY